MNYKLWFSIVALVSLFVVAYETDNNGSIPEPLLYCCMFFTTAHFIKMILEGTGTIKRDY